MSADPLADRIRGHLASPLTTDTAIDVQHELDTVLEPLDIEPQAVEFIGADPIVDSVLPLASAASIALTAKSVAIARLWEARGGEEQDIAMDLRVAPRRLCPFYEGRWELLNGMPQRSDFDIYTNLKYTDFYRCQDDRWVLPQAHYPRLRSAALNYLNAPDDRAKLEAVFAQRDAWELEAEGAEVGIVMPVIRSTEEFLAEEHYLTMLKDLPLIELERIGDADPRPFTPNPEQPFDGLNALGLAKVIAGGGVGRTLALHGADALNVWRPSDYEAPAVHHTAQFGVRSTRLSFKSEKLKELANGADIFYSNRRPQALEKYGLTPEQLAASNPGIIHTTVTLHGLHGPWAGRPGFDQTAGSVTGMMAMEGDANGPRVPIINVVNDWIVPWLATAGIASALKKRAEEGGSWRVHVSLTRVALWMLSLGIFDREYVKEVAGKADGHTYESPELLFHDSPTGRYQGVTDQVRMSKTPGRYRIGLEPIGAEPPAWRTQ